MARHPEGTFRCELGLFDASAMAKVGIRGNSWREPILSIFRFTPSDGPEGEAIAALMDEDGIRRRDE